MRPVNRFKLEFLSVPENVAFARVAVAAFASQLDFTLSDLEELKVAISEAVANAIVHGYDGAPDCTVYLEAEIHDDFLNVTVRDDGKGIEDISKALQPTYTTDSERMGLGFVFMRSFVDKLKVDSVPGKGTTVKLIKKVVLEQGGNIDTSKSKKNSSGHEEKVIKRSKKKSTCEDETKSNKNAASAREY